jgi:hypothetical protein
MTFTANGVYVNVLIERKRGRGRTISYYYEKNRIHTRRNGHHEKSSGRGKILCQLDSSNNDEVLKVSIGRKGP